MSDERHIEATATDGAALVQRLDGMTVLERLSGHRVLLVGLSMLVLILVVIGGFVGSNSSPQG